MRSVKHKILVTFCLAETAILVCLILLVSLRLDASLSRQSETILGEMERREGRALQTYLEVFDRLLAGTQEDAVRVTRLVAENPRVAAGIQRFAPKQLDAILDTTAGPADLDFSLLYDMEGTLVASHPVEVDDIQSGRLFRAGSLADALRQGIQRGDRPAVLTGLWRLSPEFLRAHGLGDREGASGGGLCALSAQVVYDGFGDPVGFCVSGKLLNGYRKPSQELLRIAGTSSAIYLGEAAVAWAGFPAESGGLPSAKALPAGTSVGGVKNPGPAAGLRILGRTYLAATRPLLDARGAVVGSLLAGVPMDSILHLEQGVRAEGETTAREIRTWMAVVGSGAMVLFLAAALGIATRTITLPLGRILRGLGEIADGRGDLTQSLTASTRDEIGDLARAFNRFVGRLRGTVEGILRVSSDLVTATRSIEATSREVNEGAADQARSMEACHGAVEEIDAAAQAIAESSDSLARTAEASSSAVLELGAASGEIADQMENLLAIVQEVSSAATTLSETTRQIMGDVESLSAMSQQTAAAVTDLTVNIERIEENSAETERLAESAERDSVSGREAVAASLQGIEALSGLMEQFGQVAGDLEGQSSSIATIVSVIEGVADETGLLALNAAIIAAQAGDHGKGFAVVADEVRDLAERTAESTQEIASIIGNLQRGTQQAVAAMEAGRERIGEEVSRSKAAEEALAKLTHSAKQTRHQAQSIARATQDQSLVGRQIRQATEQVAQTLGGASASLQQHTASAQALACSAKSMAEIASQVKFSTDEQSETNRQIGQGIVGVRAMAERIDRATRDQTERTREVLQAISSVRAIAEASVARAEELDRVVEVLSSQTRELERDVHTFQV